MTPLSKPGFASLKHSGVCLNPWSDGSEIVIDFYGLKIRLFVDININCDGKGLKKDPDLGKDRGLGRGLGHPDMD